jgi:hypothetical protein
LKYVFTAVAAGVLLALASAQPSLAESPAAATAPVIKDPAEYNAYISALNIVDPVAKAAAMEAFAAAYPTSVVQIDALEQAMAADQQAGDAAKVEAVATRILAIRPDAVRELGVVVFLVRGRATATADPQASQALAEAAAANAERGLAALSKWSKPDSIADAEFVSNRNQLASIFNGALGFRSLKRKDYAAAASYYLAALKAEPDDLTNVYQLAIAKLQSNPVDPTGFWWAARAYDLAAAAKNSAAQTSIAAFGKASYHRYHGGDDGWDNLIAAAASSGGPPAGFAVTAAPTAAELAVKAVADNDPRSLSLSDQEFVLAQRDASPANRKAAERVWAMIEATQAGAVKLKLPMKVIATTADGFDAAMTDDSQEAGRPDVHVRSSAPGAKSPAPGATVQVIGHFSSYTPQPFSFTFEATEWAP